MAKYVWFLIIILKMALNVGAQTKFPKKLEVSFSLGTNYMKLTQKQVAFDGFGFIKRGNNFYPRRNFSFGLGLSFRKNNFFELNYSQFTSSNYFPEAYQVGLVGFNYRLLELSYGKILFQNKLLIKGFLGLSYRFSGVETAVYAYKGNFPLTEPLFAVQEYNSIGFIPAIDFNYPVYRSFSAGLNISYHFYPFEKIDLKSNDIAYLNPNFKLTYKPITEFIQARISLKYTIKLFYN